MRGSPSYCGASRASCSLHRDEVRRQSLDAALAEHVGQHPRQGDAVLQREAGAAGALAAIAEHPPPAVGRAGQIGGVELEHPRSRRARAAAERQAKPGWRKEHFRRQQPVAHQALRAEEIDAAPGRAACARCFERGGDAGPLLGADHQREAVELPRMAPRRGVAQVGIRQTVLPEQPLGLLPAADVLGPGQTRGRLDETTCHAGRKSPGAAKTSS